MNAAVLSYAPTQAVSRFASASKKWLPAGLAVRDPLVGWRARAEAAKARAGSVRFNSDRSRDADTLRIHEAGFTIP